MFDIILIFFFLLMVYLGWKNGFVKAFLRFFGIFISFAISYYLYSPVSEWLIKTPLADRIENFIKNDFIKNNSPEVVLNLPLPTGIKMEMENMIESGVESAAEGISAAITTMFVSLLSMVLVFVLAFAGLRIFEFFLSSIVKLPGLSFFNKICGLIVGIINGIISIYLVIIIARALMPFAPWLARMSQNSIITNLII